MQIALLHLPSGLHPTQALLGLLHLALARNFLALTTKQLQRLIKNSAAGKKMCFVRGFFLGGLIFVKTFQDAFIGNMVFNIF